MTPKERQHLLATYRRVAELGTIITPTPEEWMEVRTHLGDYVTKMRLELNEDDPEELF